VRAGAVLGGGHDRRERHALGAAAAHGDLQVQRDVALRAADDARADDLLERRVGQHRRRADELDLGVVLDRPQRLDDPARGDELRLPLPHELAQLLVLADRQVRVVEAELERLGRQALDGPLEQVGGDLALPLGIDLLGRLREVAKVGDEAQRALADQHGRVGPVEARQPAHVDEVRHQQRVELALGQPCEQRLAARGAHSPSSRLRITSASR
jgi:hypothetical protein